MHCIMAFKSSNEEEFSLGGAQRNLNSTPTPVTDEEDVVEQLTDGSDLSD